MFVKVLQTHKKQLCSAGLKVPKCEIFDLFDFNDFYVKKSLQVGDLGMK